jgi:hypothetical protein
VRAFERDPQGTLRPLDVDVAESKRASFDGHYRRAGAAHRRALAPSAGSVLLLRFRGVRERQVDAILIDPGRRLYVARGRAVAEILALREEEDATFVVTAGRVVREIESSELHDRRALHFRNATRPLFFLCGGRRR